MFKAWHCSLGLIVAFMVLGRTARVQPEVKESELMEVAGSLNSSANPLRCPLGLRHRAKVKDYYYDMTDANDKVAVHLVRDPYDPTLFVYKGAVWTVMEGVSKDRTAVLQMVPVKVSDGTKADGVSYSLKDDMLQLKRNGKKLEFVVTKCASNSTAPKSQVTDPKQTEESDASEDAEEEDGYSSFVDLVPRKCTLKFAEGIYYKEEILTKALKLRTEDGWQDLKASEVRLLSHVAQGKTGTSKKFGPAIAAGTIGYNVPLWLMSEGASLLPFVGAAATGIPVYYLTKTLINNYKEKQKMIGSDALFEKMYCMSKMRTCDGLPCFKECIDPKGNEVLVPAHQQAVEKGIRCRCSDGLFLRC